MIKLFSNKISHLNKKVKYLQTQFSYLHIMTNFGHRYVLILTFIFTMYTLRILLTLHTGNVYKFYKK